MRNRILLLLAVAAAVGLAATFSNMTHRATAQPGDAKAPAAEPAAEDADRVAILKTAHDFEAAFNKGDAKGVSALYTEKAESREASGQTFVGRAAIGKAYAEFFKANPGVKIEVLVKSVRFPAADMAVEEGLLRQSRGSKALPVTTSYVVVHAREGGRWKMALSSEAGVGQNRLEDLDWLLGEWATKVNNDVLKFAFARDPKKPVINGTFTRTPPGKPPLVGTTRIAFDPETGHVRSWSFEDDGAHSQSIWTCDGKSWVLDLRGVLADGTSVAERIILQRVAPDAITWRAVDRVVDDVALPDTRPIRLTRTSVTK